MCHPAPLLSNLTPARLHHAPSRAQGGSPLGAMRPPRPRVGMGHAPPRGSMDVGDGDGLGGRGQRKRKVGGVAVPPRLAGVACCSKAAGSGCMSAG